MLTENELATAAAHFIEHTIPDTVSKFSAHDGLDQIRKYYLEYFIGDGRQNFNIKGLSSRYLIITNVQENYKRAIQSVQVKGGRYREYSLTVLPPISIQQGNTIRKGIIVM
ncbi:MAG: hypothetical protein AABZ11_04455 [Nitrospinota bacterium]